MSAKVLCALALVTGAAAQDPPQGWLGFATGTNPNGGRITHAEAKWVVLDNPTEGGCFYSPWFGVETSDNLNLFQPVNPWLGDSWSAYIEYFQWEPENNINSDSIQANPGDVLHGVVTFDEANQKYHATHTNKNTGGSISTSIDVQQDNNGDYKEYTILYVVFEKECSSCAQYPPNNKVTFYDMKFEYEGERVNPSWTTNYIDDVCNNRANIVDNSTISITWQS